LAGLLGVLLLVHRSDGDLIRALAEYAVVGVLALLLSFTPTTRGPSASVTAGVTGGSQLVGRLVADAWHTAFNQQPTTPPAPPAATRPAAGHRPTAPPGPSPTSTHPTGTPAPAARPAPRAGVPLGLLGLVVVVLGGLVLVSWRVRRLDRDASLGLDLGRLPRGRRRGRRAA